MIFVTDDRGLDPPRLGRMDQESTDMADREAESEYLHELDEMQQQNLDIVYLSLSRKLSPNSRIPQFQIFLKSILRTEN